jgi:hypothetical protein
MARESGPFSSALHASSFLGRGGREVPEERQPPDRASGPGITLWNGSDRARVTTAVGLPAASLVAIAASPGLKETS